MTFANKIAAQKDLIYDLRYVLNGENRFFIIKVKPALHSLFKRKIAESQGYVLEDFGEILFRGWDEPDEEIKSILRQKYGMYSN